MSSSCSRASLSNFGVAAICSSTMTKPGCGPDLYSGSVMQSYSASKFLPKCAGNMNCLAIRSSTSCLDCASARLAYRKCCPSWRAAFCRSCTRNARIDCTMLLRTPRSTKSCSSRTGISISASIARLIFSCAAVAAGTSSFKSNPSGRPSFDDAAKSHIVVAGVVASVRPHARAAAYDPACAAAVRARRLDRVLVVVTARPERELMLVVAEHDAILGIRERTAAQDQLIGFLSLPGQFGNRHGRLFVRPEGLPCLHQRGAQTQGNQK